MNKEYNSDNLELFNCILKINTIEECKAFFEDLCTIKEIDAMSQRLKAANLLLDGNTYEQVIEKTGISSTTLSRVSKCIQYGDGGYKNIIEKNK